MGPMGGGLAFQLDFLRQHSGLGDDAKTEAVTGRDESIAGAVGLGLTVTFQALGLNQDMWCLLLPP